MRKAFEERTGAFGPEDAWFEARGQAFWDDALTTQKFGSRAPTLVETVSEGARSWSPLFERAHRGLFRAFRDGQSFTLEDLWGNAAFVIDPPSEALASALHAACEENGEEQLFDGRIVGSADPFSVTLLSGAVFHRAEASVAIASVLDTAKARGLSRDDALDSLLRMDRKLQSHARVKATYAYRAELLTQKSAQ
ncbi:MAG: hypothetical protein ABI183_08700 [Polyangiaceae bacterium]